MARYVASLQRLCVVHCGAQQYFALTSGCSIEAIQNLCTATLFSALCEVLKSSEEDLVENRYVFTAMSFSAANAPCFSGRESCQFHVSVNSLRQGGEFGLSTRQTWRRNRSQQGSAGAGGLLSVGDLGEQFIRREICFSSW